MHFQTYHLKSPWKAEAEDAYAIHPEAGLFAVMDGVTPLDAYKDGEGHNGAHIAANLFRASFEQGKSQTDLTQLILDANRQLRDRMMQAGIDLSILHELWSTCVAAVKLEPDVVRYAQLGDSMIVAVYHDGRIVAVTENRVRGVTQRAKLAREEARRRGEELPDESYYDIPHNRNQANRWLANCPDGYGVANGMETIDTHLQAGVLPRGELRHLLLLTDGLFHPELELTDACAELMRLGLERYAEVVIEAERRHDSPPDDRTCIWITM